MDGSGLAGHCSEFGEGNGENMKFQCLNPNCKKVFLYTAKQTKDSELAVDEGAVIETHVCPYCHGLDFEELVETVPG